MQPTRVIPAPVYAPPSISALTRSSEPDPDTANLHNLIAHYLCTYYPAALPAFLSASGAADPATLPPPGVDLRTLVLDAASAARADELAAKLASTEINPGGKVPLDKLLAVPVRASLGPEKHAFPVAVANLLSVAVADVPFRSFDTATAAYVAGRKRCVLVSGADREVRVVDYASGEVTESLTHKAPVLTLAVHPTQPRYLVTGSMDGTTVLRDLLTREALQTFTSGKFVVRVAFSHDGKFLATASYDHTVCVYVAEEAGTNTEDEVDPDTLDETDDAALAASPSLRYALVHTVRTDANPEALLFHPAADWLLYTVRASHELHYLRLPTPSTATVAAGTETWGARTKSFNPHPLDSHVSFAVLDLALHPSGRAVACVTGDHAGTAGERVLVYGIEPDETTRLACLWTGNEPDAFVLPRVRWLPDGSGVLASGATGHIALISNNGEVRARPQVHAAQGPGTSDVVRDFVVVQSEGEGEAQEEAEAGWEVVSVGYDRCVRITPGVRDS